MPQENVLPPPDHRDCEILTGLTVDSIPHDGSRGRAHSYRKNSNVMKSSSTYKYSAEIFEIKLLLFEGLLILLNVYCMTLAVLAQNKPCKFDLETLQFMGKPVEQAILK